MPAPSPPATGYLVRVVERDGTWVRDLVKANVLPITHRLNDPEAVCGNCEFTVPKFEQGAAIGQVADIELLNREVQVYRHGELYAWGIPTRDKAKSGVGAITYTCPSASWPITRRNIDSTPTNYLSNPLFETNLTGWTAVNCTATRITSTTVRGPAMLQLVGTTTWGDQYERQTVSITGTAVGTELTLAAWFYIVDADWVAPALDSRGLYVELDDGVNFQTANWFEIDDATPRGVLQRAEITTWIPPLLTWNADVRLYAPNGKILWGALQLVAPESFAVPEAGEDIAVVAKRLAEFAQDPAFEKDDLSIDTPTPTNAGVTLAFPWAKQFADHAPIDRVLNEEVVPLGLDWSLVLDDSTDPATKTFTTFAPRKGTDLTGTLELEFGVNVASYEFDRDGTSTETDVTMLGDGDGPDRELGRAVDTSEVDLVLQGNVPAPTGSLVSQLDSFAADRLSRTKRIVRTLTVVTHNRNEDIPSIVSEGDVVPVVIDDGVVQVASDWRILARTLTPRAETMQLTLSEEP